MTSVDAVTRHDVKLVVMGKWPNDMLGIEFVPPIPLDRLEESADRRDRLFHPESLPPNSRDIHSASVSIQWANNGIDLDKTDFGDSTTEVVARLLWNRRALEDRHAASPEGRLLEHAKEVAAHIGGAVLDPRPTEIASLAS